MPLKEERNQTRASYNEYKLYTRRQKEIHSEKGKSIKKRSCELNSKRLKNKQKKKKKHQ